MYALCSETVYMNVEWARSAHLSRELKVGLVFTLCVQTLYISVEWARSAHLFRELKVGLVCL